MLQLAVIVLNYRTPQLVIDCLDSLNGQIDPATQRVVIVDNCSGDDSVEKISSAIAANAWNTWAELIPSPVNGGFSAGNNVGIQAVAAENYILLNSDTIVRPGAIAALMRGAAAHPEVGIFSPRLEWPDGEPQISCFRYRSPASEIIEAAETGPVTNLLAGFNVPIPVSDEPFEPEWTSFACVWVRRAVIEKVGLMDEGYFMYLDDVDYCRQTREAGWRILHWPEARVVHLRGGSGTVKKELATRKRARPYLYASRSRYFAKFYGGRVGLLLANLCWYLGRGISLLREATGRESHVNECAAQDIWIGWQAPLRPYIEIMQAQKAAAAAASQSKSSS